jgi:multidrug resistance efflux pump
VSEFNPDQALRSAQQFFSGFIQLEKLARQAVSIEVLQFTMVNETRRLFEYRQAAFVTCQSGANAKAVALSGVAVLDYNAPFIEWLHRLVEHLRSSGKADDPVVMSLADAPEFLSTDWREWSPPHIAWLPLKDRSGSLAAGLWLARDTPWREADIALLNNLTDAYAHAWLALSGPKRLRRELSPHKRKFLVGGVVAALLFLLFPVSQSSLAPAQIVAGNPVVVAAPLDGIVADFSVDPNQVVEAGQELFRFDDTTVKNRKIIAERELQVAEAELKRATQGAFSNAESSSQVALLKSRVDLKQAELDYAVSVLDRVIVRAERSGVAIFNDPKEWTGRPVSTGERILLLADPADVKLRADLPVKQMLPLDEGATMVMFLDSDPLNPLEATLERAGYEAQPQPDGSLAYTVLGRFEDGTTPRIGLHGTAKIHSDSVPLFLYLFRRPLSELRQMLGL